MAQGLTERIQGTSSFLFGWADSPLQRGLAQRRKEMGWFKKTIDLQAIRPDVGPQPQKRFGLTGEPALGDKVVHAVLHAAVGKWFNLKVTLDIKVVQVM